jgi:hypothetical protein
MATTIDQSFLRFKQNLEITGLQGETVSVRQANVRKAVESGLTVVDSFLTGSYRRNTMIGPLKEADIDVFVVLDPAYFHNYNGGKNNAQAGLLDRVKRVLLKTYAATPDISRNGQAVTIRFTDFVVDVVPGFNRQNGGYLIPNSLTGTWLSTDPKKHVELVTAANTTHAGDFVPLVKMIKAWNKTIGKPFRSFHLEVLALEVLNRVTISDLPSGARFFFDKGRSLIAGKTPDPAGYGDDIGAYINSQQAVLDAVARFQLAYDRAIKAEDYARRGYVREAVEMWTKIFGDYFPAYG